MQKKRERFLITHNADAPPPELLAPPPRRLRGTIVLAWVWVLLFLLFGIRFFEKTVVSSFKQVEAREVATREWIQKQTAKPPSSERDARNQRLVREVSETEAEAVRELRRIMGFAAIPIVLVTVIAPLLAIWFLIRIHRLLRSGIAVRAEMVSRKSWSGSAHLSFVTTDGRRVETTQTVPVYVPIGAKLWVLYSQQRPKHALLYRPDAELLTKRP